MPEVLILYYSHYGATAEMARTIARGVEEVAGVSAKLRTVPEVSPCCEATEETIPDSGAPYVSEVDLRDCDGLILGQSNPLREYGRPNETLPRHHQPTLGGGVLIDKPASVFTSTSSLHGGQESTLLVDDDPLAAPWHADTGVPYSETALLHTKSGGTPYGASHLAGGDSKLPVTDEEKRICKTQGRRMAETVKRLEP